MICTHAPAPNQYGPDTPYAYATVLDWSNAAAHVHADTTAAAVSPVLSERPAVLKNSAEFDSPDIQTPDTTTDTSK